MPLESVSGFIDAVEKIISHGSPPARILAIVITLSVLEFVENKK
jgi:hypothetical protein